MQLPEPKYQLGEYVRVQTTEEAMKYFIERTLDDGVMVPESRWRSLINKDLRIVNIDLSEDEIFYVCKNEKTGSRTLIPEGVVEFVY